MRERLFLSLSKTQNIMKAEDFHTESQHHKLYPKYANTQINHHGGWGGKVLTFTGKSWHLSPDYLHFTILCHLFSLSPFNPYV